MQADDRTQPTDREALSAGAEAEREQAEDVSPAPLPSRRLSPFRLGEALFGVDSELCREVAAVGAHTLVPGTPSYLLGVTNLRGEVLPLLEIRGLLGQTAEPGAGREPVPGKLVLVLRSGRLLAGLVVDEVLGLEPYHPSLLAPLAGPSTPPLNALALGVFRRSASLHHPARQITVLDADRLLGDLRLWTATTLTTGTRRGDAPSPSPTVPFADLAAN